MNNADSKDKDNNAVNCDSLNIKLEVDSIDVNRALNLSEAERVRLAEGEARSALQKCQRHLSKAHSALPRHRREGRVGGDVPLLLAGGPGVLPRKIVNN